MADPHFTLITPEISSPEDFAPLLAAALEATPFAAVVIRAAGGDDGLTRAAKTLVPLIQAAGAAALLHSPLDPRIVARLKADGAHHGQGLAGLKETVESLKPDRIVGVSRIKSRHEAMEAGEADIDYMMFGEPRADGSIPDLEGVLERAQWWAEIFNPPCVAYARDLAGIPDLAATGAEFIALGPWIFEGNEPAVLLREARRLATTEKTKP